MNVYVIASDGGMCKIGKADNPVERMKSLYTGHPYKMTLAYMRPHFDPLRIEGEAHRRLAEHRMSGEWFQVPPLTAIETLERIMRGVPAIAKAAPVLSVLGPGAEDDL